MTTFNNVSAAAYWVNLEAPLIISRILTSQMKMAEMIHVQVALMSLVKKAPSFVLLYLILFKYYKKV